MIALLLWLASWPTVPNEMIFCGVRLTIQPGAQKAIQDQIIKLNEHPPTLAALVARAETLLPYIEEGLRYIGVPEDLKYLAIQESRLQPNAISRSMAVGYWQMKDYTAREVGLVINDTIDERRHLFRATAGAALYLAKQYIRHRNWLYAIIAYYEGGSGAIPYIDTSYVGKEEACITETCHWYAIRAIAYKLTFEPLIRRRVYGLRPLAYQGPPKPAYELALAHGLSPDSFLLLNPWLLKPILPGGRPSTYYVPADSLLEEVPQEPLKALFKPASVGNPVSVPVAVAVSFESPGDTPSPSPPKSSLAPEQPAKKASLMRVRPGEVASLPIAKEPTLGKEWVYPPKLPLSPKLARYNVFHTGDGPVLIVAPGRATIHIVQQGETPEAIATHYKVPLEKLLSYNRLSSSDTILPRGLRVYLREARPYDEAPICYKW